MKPRSRLSLVGVALALMVLAGLAAGCGAKSGDSEAHALAMAPLSDMPADVQAAPEAVRQAYQFAAANPHVLEGVPCYCGCVALGHVSNYDCYIAEAADGTLTFDEHALVCQVCVDITQDAMRLLKEGKSVPDIKAYVDVNYARYGTSTMP